MRRILKPWHRVKIPEIPASVEGLADVSRVMLMLVIRNQMFLKALGLAGVERSVPALSDFLAANEALVGNLSMLRTMLVGALEVPDVVESAREASHELTTLRTTVLESLDAEVVKRVMEAEWRVPVSIADVRAEMDSAGTVISKSADQALDSDWFDRLSELEASSG